MNFEDEADEDEAERFRNQGIRELPSPAMLEVKADETGLGKEEDAGLGL